MKKQFRLLLLLCLACILAAGCTPGEGEKYGSTQEIQPPVKEAKATEAPTQIVSVGDQPETIKADVDLTVLSSTMVYAEVNNIMMKPDSYIGKTVKGRGIYDSFYYDEIDKHFHYFVISDATGCCPQGLGFEWNGEHIFPDDYPELGEEIEVTGVFVEGEIEGHPYYYLEADTLIHLE